MARRRAKTPSEQVLRVFTVMVGLWGVIEGILIVTGGAIRWRGASYDTALQFPGAPSSWGLVILAAGVTVVVGMRCRWHLSVAVSLLLTSTWSMFFAISFANSARTIPTAGNTATPTYVLVALLSACLAWKSLLDRIQSRATF